MGIAWTRCSADAVRKARERRDFMVDGFCGEVWIRVMERMGKVDTQVLIGGNKTRWGGLVLSKIHEQRLKCQKGLWGGTQCFIC